MLIGTIIDANKYSVMDDCWTTITAGYQWLCMHYLTIPTLLYNCNKYCDLIGHSEARDCDKRSEIVDLQLTNQIPGLLYPTIPLYNTYITII